MLHTTLGLDEILQREITTDWFEGVAVIQAVCRAVPGVSTSGTGFPSPKQISITATGEIELLGVTSSRRRGRGGRPAAWRNAPQRRAGPPAIDSQRGGCEPPRFRIARRARASACLLRAAGRPTDAPDTVRPGISRTETSGPGRRRACGAPEGSARPERCAGRARAGAANSRAEPKASIESVVSGCARNRARRVAATAFLAFGGRERMFVFNGGDEPVEGPASPPDDRARTPGATKPAAGARTSRTSETSSSARRPSRSGPSVQRAASRSTSTRQPVPLALERTGPAPSPIALAGFAACLPPTRRSSSRLRTTKSTTRRACQSIPV